MIEGAVWRKNLEHEGIEIEFPGKPAQEVIDDLKANGFRWARFNKVWYSKGHDYQVAIANKYAAYDGEVGEKMTFAEKMDAKLKRADNRAERYSGLAEKNEAKSEALYNEAHRMADVIPLGQPILVGHHSEGRDRRYLERIHNKFGESVETQKKAEYFEQRASSSADFKDRTYNLGTTIRRIKKLEADARSITRSVDKHIFEWQTYHLNPDHPNHEYSLLSKTHLQWGENRLDVIDEQLEYWRAVVVEHEKDGKKVWSKADFKAGEVIMTGFGRATVKRVNPTTLAVIFFNDSLNLGNSRHGFKIPYDDLPQDAKSFDKSVVPEKQVVHEDDIVKHSPDVNYPEIPDSSPTVHEDGISRPASEVIAYAR